MPTLETVEAIAQALGSKVTDLLEEDSGNDPWIRQLTTLGASVPSGQRSLVIAVLSAIVRHAPRERSRKP